MLLEVSMVSACLLHQKESADGHEHGHFRESCVCIFNFMVLFFLFINGLTS